MPLVSVDYVILGILSTLPSSGYDMKQELEYGGAGYFSALTYGSIYPRLKVLEDEGYIVALEADPQGRRRRVYDLAPKGWKALETWLDEPPAYPIPMRDELLLRMVFWTVEHASSDREKLIGHLRRRREQSVALLDRITHREEHFGYISEVAMLTVTHMEGRLRAELEWIDACIAKLEGPPTGPAQDPRDLEALQRERRARAFEAPQAGDVGAASRKRPTRRSAHREGEGV